MDIVLNWLWQGGLVAFAAATVLRVVPRSRTLARYWTLWTACLVVATLPAVPLLFAPSTPLPAAASGLASLGPAFAIPTAWWTSAALAVGLWIVWSVASAARLLVAAAGLIAAKRESCECPPDLEGRLHTWSRVRTTGRRTRLVLSTRVRAAAVLGCGSPVIAVTPALREHLSDVDLDRVVIHEWAHVQRRDDIAQLVQRFVRIVAGWHPAVWWLERQLELEREVACDEIVVALTGSAKEYASCLATLAALSIRSVPAWPAPAVLSSSGLRRRLVRILAARGAGTTRPWRAMAISASGLLAAFALLVGHVDVVKSADQALVLPLTAELRPAKAVAINPSPALVRPIGLERFPIVRSVRLQADVRRPAEAGRYEIVKTALTATSVVVEPPASTVTQWPALSEPPLDDPTVLGAPAPPQIPEQTRVEPHPSATADNTPSADTKTRTPWTTAADVGVALGRGSQNAGVATAGFFSRVAKKVAGSF